MIYWQQHTYKEIEEKISDDLLVILPIGSIEEHSFHLPLNTDTLQALYVVEEIAKRTNALILPQIEYGWVKSVESFKGTISIEFDTLRMLVKDILTSLVNQGIKNILILTGHASSAHISALKMAALDIEEAKIMLLSDYDIAFELRGSLVPEDDNHAGIIETSRILSIKKEVVRDKMEFEKIEMPKYMVIKDKRKYYPKGTFSNPEGANEKLGEDINKIIIDRITELIKENFRS
jgi:creatinine amidohydrolase